MASSPKRFLICGNPGCGPAMQFWKMSNWSRLSARPVETNIHYPTDSSLMGDGVRVLTRLMKRITEITGAAGTKLRDRTRSVKLRVVEIARASRSKSEQGRERMKGLYEKLLTATAAV